MKISACVIVKDEARNILRWLECMKKIAHEMIVVDTGSVDNTVEIARSYGAKVFAYEWKQDFSAAKNYAIEKASGDWLLFLDADEWFAPESMKVVPMLIRKYHGQKNVDAIVCRIINIDEDKQNIVITTFPNIRIFRNRTYLRYCGCVHEMLQNTNKEIQLCMLDKEIDIYHTGYSSGVLEKKLRRNLALLLQDIKINGEQPEHYHYLCDCYHGLKEYDKVVEYAEKHFASEYLLMSGDHELYKKWIDGLVLGGYNETTIFAAIETAMRKYPQEPTFPYCKGDLLMQVERYEEAQAAFQQAIDLDQREQDSHRTDLFVRYRHGLYYDLGVLRQLQNRRDEAAAYFLDALQINRYDEKNFLAFYRLLQDLPPVEWIELLNSIYQTDKSADLQFLLEAFRNLPPSKVEVYYQNIAKKKGINMPETLYRSLWVAGRQEEAILEMADSIEEAYMDLIVATVAEMKKGALKKELLILPLIYQNAMRAIFEQAISLTDAEKNIRREILERLEAIGVMLPETS